MILQALLFFGVMKGKNLNDISDEDLILSISAAIFNSFVQIFRLKKESKAVQETFVQYALNCITARFVEPTLFDFWIPETITVKIHSIKQIRMGSI